MRPLRRHLRTASFLMLSCWAALPPGAAAAQAGVRAMAEVRVERVVVRGNRVIPDAEIEAITQSLAGRRVGVAEIEALRQQLSRLYAERGYVSSGVLFDDPLWVEGELRLRAVEGAIDSVHISGTGDLADAYLLRRLLGQDPVLHLPALQARYRLLIEDPLFERVDVAIQPGIEPGAAALDIQVLRARPWELTLFGNNYRSASTGEMQAGALGSIRNLTGYGDALHLEVRGASGGELASGGWTLPVDDGSSRLSVQIQNGDTRIVEAPLDDADVQSRLHASEVSLEHDVLRSADRMLGLGLSYAERSVRSSLFGEPFSFSPGEDDGLSRVRVWRLSQSFSGRWPGAVLALRSTFSVGSGNVTAVDGIPPGQLPEADFLHWTGQASGQWRPGRGSGWLQARLAVQKAQDRLLGLERFAVGGHATVRGYRENTLVRDNGYAASVEWHWLAERLGGGIDPFVFHDRGAAWNRNGERALLRSLGLGIAIHFEHLHGELSWARAIDDRPETAERRLQDRGIHLAVSYVF